MLKKVLIIAAIAIVLATAAVLVIGYLVWAKGPDLSKYQHLKEPRISEMPNQKMLVVAAKGDPNVVGTKAFGILFSTYFKTVKGGKMQIPRARWPHDLGTQLDEWQGLYALPVPESVDRLPELKPEPGFTVKLETWDYGTVAEILHVGPYNLEEPAVEKLKKFIHDSGYYIDGLHEEEYLKGPGMFGRGDPKKYHTIIRYRISKPSLDSSAVEKR